MLSQKEHTLSCNNIMHLKNLIMVLIMLVATGCSKPKQIELWGNKPMQKGAFALTIGGDPFSIYGTEAFIDSKAMLVDCQGSPILLGNNRSLYLTAKQSILPYNFDLEQIEPEYSLAEIAEQYGRPVQKDRIVSTTRRPSNPDNCTPKKAINFVFRT